jgi:hypothetical protein
VLVTLIYVVAFESLGLRRLIVDLSEVAPPRRRTADARSAPASVRLLPFLGGMSWSDTHARGGRVAVGGAEVAARPGVTPSRAIVARLFAVPDRRFAIPERADLANH